MVSATGKFPLKDARYATGIKAACGTHLIGRAKQTGAVPTRILLRLMKIFVVEFGMSPAQGHRYEWTYMTAVMACQRDGPLGRGAFWKGKTLLSD